MSSFLCGSFEFRSLLSRCSTLKHMKQAHAFMIPRCLDHDNLLLGEVILANSRLGFKGYAFSIFESIENPDVYLCNSMIRTLSRNDSAREAVHLFNRIRMIGLKPDTYSFPFILRAVVKLSLLQLGREIHGLVLRIGLGSDVHVSTGLVHMYSSCGGLADARQLFDEIPTRDVVVWNAMMAGYVKDGNLDDARLLFDGMPERNVISWTTIIAGYAQVNRPADAITVFRRMQLEGGIEPDEIALLSALSACAQLGALDLGEWIHRSIDKQRLAKIVPLMNALIDMYAKSGNIAKALDVFESMEERSIVSWTTMIAGLSFHGLLGEALNLFDRMERENLRPNDITFIAVLSACSHIGRTDLGHRYFRRMTTLYQIKPKIEHYGCLVDLLARAGNLKEAFHLVQNMPFKANAAIWGALLAAARTYGDLNLGEYAVRNLIEIEPDNSGNYMLLSNIYASHGRWKHAGRMRKMMKDERVTKLPGGSSFELAGIVHEFTSRDSSHSRAVEIYELLCWMDDHLDMIGCTPLFHEELPHCEAFLREID